MSWENVIVEFYVVVKTFASKNLLKMNPTADIFQAVTVTASEYSMALGIFLKLLLSVPK